jgi:hypothetical protein
MASDAGSTALTGKRDFDKAKKLIAEAGYKGEKIVVLDAVDQPFTHAEALGAADLMKKLGLNVEIAASDWGTLVTRRASKKPIEEGGWNLFATGWVGADTLDPSLNVMLRANGEAAWFGWPTDDKLEGLRTEWLRASDSETRQEIASKIQERAFEVVPYIPTGMWAPKTRIARTSGVITGPAFSSGTWRRPELLARCEPNRFLANLMARATGRSAMAHRMTRRDSGLPPGGIPRRPWARAKAQSAASKTLLYRPVGSPRPRPDLDDVIHHPQPRLHGIRHAVCARRHIQAASADGWRLQYFTGQARL